MSQENVELVRTVYSAPDMLAITDVVAPDVEFDFSEVFPERPVLRGNDAMRGFREEAWREPVSFEVEQIIDVDAERVLVVVQARTVGRSTGAAVDTRAAHEITVHRDRIVRVKVYPELDAALEAVGLSE